MPTEKAGVGLAVTGTPLTVNTVEAVIAPLMGTVLPPITIAVPEGAAEITVPLTVIGAPPGTTV